MEGLTSKPSPAPASQVPYTLVDEDIPDDWACADNVWDPEHQSCDIPQALSDERIDEILLQQVQLEVSPGPEPYP